MNVTPEEAKDQLIQQREDLLEPYTEYGKDLSNPLLNYFDSSLNL